MTMQITPFAFGDNMVRVRMDESGNLWFVAKDVCGVLELDNSNISRQGYLDDDEKGLYTVQTPGGEQEMLTVSESGLYSLIFRSRKPEAKAFRKWVTSEVLPTLRRTGRFAISGASHEQPLPQGLSSETARRLNEFSGPRIALTESVLHLAELMGVKDRQSVTTLFDIYAATFLSKEPGLPKPGLPEAVEKAIWNDIDSLLQGKSCNPRCKARLFVSLCGQMKRLCGHFDDSLSVRAALLEHVYENYE